MAVANHIRLGLAASPPCEAYRPRVADPALGAGIPFLTQGDARLIPITGFIAAAAAVGFATNLSMHLRNLRMQPMGLPGFEIGARGALPALVIPDARPGTDQH